MFFDYYREQSKITTFICFHWYAKDQQNALRGTSLQILSIYSAFPLLNMHSLLFLGFFPKVGVTLENHLCLDFCCAAHAM